MHCQHCAASSLHRSGLSSELASVWPLGLRNERIKAELVFFSTELDFLLSLRSREPVWALTRGRDQGHSPGVIKWLETKPT